MSTFDAAAFENQIIEEANETKSTPAPEGIYEGLIESVQYTSLQSKKSGEPMHLLNVLWLVTGPEQDMEKLQKLLNRDKILIRQTIWLEVTEQGKLAFGPNQNLMLGRVREATGFNKKGKPFGFKQLEGAGPCRIHVGLSKPNEAGDQFNNVTKVEKL